VSTPRGGTVAAAGTQEGGSRTALYTVLFVVFLDLVGFGIVIPILPFYVRTFTTNDVFIGLLAASYSLMQFAFAPLLGRLSDRYGRRPVLLASLSGATVAWTIFGLGGALWVLFLSRMLAGGMGGNIAAAQAYVADVTPRSERAGALGLVGAAFGLGFVFGPALGGFFASDPVVAAARDLLPAGVPATPYSVPSFAAAGFSLLALVVGAVFLREPDRDRSAPAPRGSWHEPLLRALRGRRGEGASGAAVDPLERTRRRRFRALVVAFFTFSLAFSGVQVMFVPFLDDVFGYDASQAALLLTYVGALGALNQGVVVGRLARRFPEAKLAVAGAVALLCSLAALPFTPEIGAALLGWVPGPALLTPELVAMLAVLTLLSVGNGLLSVSLTALVSATASDGTQGAAFGVTQGAGSLGRTVGPPAMAALYAAAAYWSPFVVGAALVVPILWIGVWLGRPG
jgi:MFS family permease